MANSNVLNQIVSYGVQNKKKKDEIMSAILKSGQVDVGTAASSLKALSDAGAFDYEKETSTNPLEVDQSKLSSTQNAAYNYGTRMLESGKVISDLESDISSKHGLSAVGQKLEEMAVGGTTTNQFVSPEFKQFDQAQRDFINATLRRESGAAIADSEFENAKTQYFPVPGDDAKTLEQKRKNRELATKNFLGEAGVNTKFIDFSGKQEPSAPSNKPEPGFAEAMDFARQNPDDPRAKNLIEAVRTGKVDPITGKKIEGAMNQNINVVQDGEQKIPTTPEEKANRIVQANSQANQLKKEADYANSFKGFMNNFLDALGENTGMKKFGQGIGATIFLNSAQGKELQDKAAKGDGYALEALNQILQEAPSAKEVIGSAAMTALNVLSGGLASKSAQLVSKTPEVLSMTEKAINLGKNVVKGAVTGYGYDVASNLEQNKDEVLKPGLGTVIGAAAAPTLELTKALKSRKALKLSNEAEKAVGQIVQGEKKDVAPAIETFKRVDTKKVKTYEDLSNGINENNKALGQAMNEVLAKDQTPRKLSELNNVTEVGGKKVKTNFVKQALDDLGELYAKTNSPANEQRIKNLIEKSKKEGLTVSEVNDIAKEYGSKNKSFNKKTGQPITSVNAEAYENTRKGVKDTLRNLLPDETARNIDKALSENLNTKRLVDNMTKKVNSLEQKVNERTLLQKGGRLLGSVVDTATGGVVKSFFTKFLVESNLGLKSMNALDLQGALSKNIKRIDAVLKSKPGMIENNTINLIKELTKEYSIKDFFDKAKTIRPGLNIESTIPKLEKAAKTMDADDVDNIRFFVDSVKTKKAGSIEGAMADLPKGAEQLLKDLGIPKTASNEEIADVLSQLLDTKFNLGKTNPAVGQTVDLMK